MTVPEFVTGPASRACGACHRSEWIKDDVAGRPYVPSMRIPQSFGTLAENDVDDSVLFEIIFDIMELFE